MEIERRLIRPGLSSPGARACAVATHRQNCASTVKSLKHARPNAHNGSGCCSAQQGPALRRRMGQPGPLDVEVWRVRSRGIPVVASEIRTIDLLTDIATRYYLQNDSQTDIARALGLDPSTVSRYLKRAREEGIVHVEIRPPRRQHLDLGRELAARFGLARVLVAPNDGESLDNLGAVAAEYLEGQLRSHMRLGVSWGRTLGAVVRHLRPGAVANLRIAQLAGGMDDPTPGIQGHELVRAVADLYPGSQVHYVHAPAIVASTDVRRAFLSDRTVQTALEAGCASELALVGIGSMDVGATLVRGGHVSPEEWAGLVESGAVGNMNARFFDAAGQPVGDLDERTIALEWAALGAVPTVMAVAGGSDKVMAIEAALRGGVVDVLVTDEATAVEVMGRH